METDAKVSSLGVRLECVDEVKSGQADLLDDGAVLSRPVKALWRQRSTRSSRPSVRISRCFESEDLFSRHR